MATSPSTRLLRATLAESGNLQPRQMIFLGSRGLGDKGAQPCEGEILLTLLPRPPVLEERDDGHAWPAPAATLILRRSGQIVLRSRSAASISSRSDLPLHLLQMPESIAIFGAPWHGKSMAQSVGNEWREKVTSHPRQSGRWSEAYAIQSSSKRMKMTAATSRAARAANHICRSDRRMIVLRNEPPSLDPKGSQSGRLRARAGFGYITDGSVIDRDVFIGCRPLPGAAFSFRRHGSPRLRFRRARPPRRRCDGRGSAPFSASGDLRGRHCRIGLRRVAPRGRQARLNPVNQILLGVVRPAIE